jgi:aspartate--ammonia ligase
MFKPRLLRETAEIALTHLKRFIEPRLTDDFSLRRVSAPLYLPIDSGLNDEGEAIRFTLPMSGEEVEIVRGLDTWLRSQLIRYDIAPGFGVFTIMNAIRPELVENATSSPHVSAWAWQQVVAKDDINEAHLEATCRKLYELLQKSEKMLLEMFPHLTATLPATIEVVKESQLAELLPDLSEERREYQYLHDNELKAVLLMDNSLRSKILIWNKAVGRSLAIAETSINLNRPVASIGGNILRDQFAMQVLHQNCLLR